MVKHPMPFGTPAYQDFKCRRDRRRARAQQLARHSGPRKERGQARVAAFALGGRERHEVHPEITIECADEILGDFESHAGAGPGPASGQDLRIWTGRSHGS